MDRRLELQALLETIVTPVYFQPPETVTIQYPCIIYRRDAAKVQYADDVRYRHFTRYQVTAVDRDPDSTIGPALAELKHCEFERFYTADELNHDVYNLFF